MTTAVGERFAPEPRVLYSKAPLVQVTCQLKFPPLLALERGIPVGLQEQIRRRFPLLDRPLSVPLPPPLPAQVVQAIRAQAGIAGWRFSTEDKRSVIALSSDLLVLTTTNYVTWGRFIQQWRQAFLALVELYSPSYFDQASLRYQDLIVRENIVIAHPAPAIASPGRLADITNRTVSSTEARLAFAVLTTERKAA